MGASTETGVSDAGAKSLKWTAPLLDLRCGDVCWSSCSGGGGGGCWGLTGVFCLAAALVVFRGMCGGGDSCCCDVGSVDTARLLGSCGAAACRLPRRLLHERRLVDVGSGAPRSKLPALGRDAATESDSVWLSLLNVLARLSLDA